MACAFFFSCSLSKNTALFYFNWDQNGGDGWYCFWRRYGQTEPLRVDAAALVKEDIPRRVVIATRRWNLRRLYRKKKTNGIQSD